MSRGHPRSRVRVGRERRTFRGELKRRDCGGEGRKSRVWFVVKESLLRGLKGNLHEYLGVWRGTS